MSQLQLSAPGQDNFYLNVLEFTSPIVGEMNAGQTRTQTQYFPIKAFQPSLVCSVIFGNEGQWEEWQTWARTNMVNAQNLVLGSPGSVTLNWPERNINNWTAIIPSAKAGGMRWNYAPRTQIEFQLVVSLVSNLATFAGLGSSAWQTIFSGTVGGSNLDSIFQLPTSSGSNGSNSSGAFLGGGTTSSSLNFNTAGSTNAFGSFGSVTSSLGSITGGLGSGSLGSLTGALGGLTSVVSEVGSIASLIPGVGSLLSII